MGERDECRLAFEEEEEDMANRFIDDAAVMEVIEHDMAWESNRKHDWFASFITYTFPSFLNSLI